MPKPCGHDPPRCRPGEPYTLDQCRVCWLFEHNPAYRPLWDGPPERPGDCVHLGRVLDRRSKTCRGCWVRECELHGNCVVNRDAPVGVRSCQDCPDYGSEREPEDTPNRDGAARSP